MNDSELQDMAYSTALSIVSATRVTTEEALRDAAETGAAVVERIRGGSVDRVRLIRDLESVLNVLQPDSVVLVDDEGHAPWIDERRAEIAWAFAERYLRYLREAENRPPAVLDRLDRLTMRVLGHLEDPARVGEWDRRGLVVGQVQSGKTGHYVGLVCRAVDAGYPLVVVLAGLHNSLRSQTQLRLDQGFLGFDTQQRQRTDAAGDFASAALGVGRLHGAPRLAVVSLTTSAEKGDFLTSRARAQPLQLGVVPVLLVVKKHTGILRNLRRWILEAAGTGDPRLVREFPLLLLDDEADYASVSTADPYVDGQYRPDDVDPTKVNAAIRDLLNAFERKAYVGYTATPNANIYVPPDVDHREWGRDIFPRHFIEYVLPPTNYFGPARLLGLEDEDDGTPPLVRPVEDYMPWVPDRHPNGHRPGPLPGSLREALRAFVLSRAVRLARGQTGRHNSMLVHVTRFQNVQDAVRNQVQEELDDIRGRLRFGDDDDGIVEEFRALWEADFGPTSAVYPGLDPSLHVGWSEVEARLEEAVGPIETRLINGTAREALEYFEREAEGFNVVAIGGNKLSRGLTLEGLSVSYYLRAAGAHDTLLQMGRWFGYREGYEDLCRLYTTGSLLTAFRGVAEANQELIGDFVDMAEQGRRPIDYGLKIRDTVAGMLVTSRTKMRTATKRRLGFSGEAPETVVFHADAATAARNLAVLDAFISRLGTPDERLGNGNLVWRTADGTDVSGLFFRRYRSPLSAWKVQGDAIAAYIDDRLAHGELVEWTVVLASSSEPGATPATIGGQEVNLFVRGLYRGTEGKLAGEGRFSIKLLRSPTDEYTDLDPDQRAAAMELTLAVWRENPGRRRTQPATPVGWAVRRQRDPRRALLVVYPVRPPTLPDGYQPAVELTTGPVVGFLASFPHSPGAPTVEYQVNLVYNDLFYGADEGDEEDD